MHLASKKSAQNKKNLISRFLSKEGVHSFSSCPYFIPMAFELYYARILIFGSHYQPERGIRQIKQIRQLKWV